MPVLPSPSIFFRRNRTLTPLNRSFKHARPIASEGSFRPPTRLFLSSSPRPATGLPRNSSSVTAMRRCAATSPAWLAPISPTTFSRRLQSKFFRKLRFLREPAVFHAWTLRIASRIAISHLKRAHRWQPLDDSPLGTFTPNPDLGVTPDAAFLSLLDHVSPASRAVLLLHYQHDLSLEETAAILDIPVGTAKSRLHYGVATLRKHLTLERKPV